nr:MAG TPA: Head fiber protein [Caudoviricetes sp.]
MGMTVNRRKDTRTPRVFMHKVADIRGGVSVNTAELGGDYLKEGSVLSAPIDGICHVVKVAEVVAEVQASEKAIKVKKGHNFKVGDFVLIDENAVAVKITKIDDATSKESDTLTISEALGAIAIGGAIAEAKEASSASDNKSALKYVPLAVAGTGKPVEKKTNLDVDAWLIGVTKGNVLPACVSKYLTGIINY